MLDFENIPAEYECEPSAILAFREKINAVCKFLTDEKLDNLFGQMESNWAAFVVEKHISEQGDYCPIEALSHRSPIRQFIAQSTNGSQSPQPLLALGAALVTFGTAAGRIYAGPTGLRTNIYAMGLADSGSGKDRALRTGSDVLIHSAPELLGEGEIASGQAINSMIQERPTVAIFMDEGGEVLAQATHEKAPQHLKSIHTNMTKLYSQAQGIYTGTAKADRKTQAAMKVYNPCLSVFAVSNPVSFFDGQTEKTVRDGSLARYVLFEVKDNNPYRSRAKIDPSLNEAIIETIVQIRTGSTLYKGPEIDEREATKHSVDLTELVNKGIDLPMAIPKPYIVPYADKAAENFGDYLQEYVNYEKIKLSGKGYGALVARCAENALKMATILAITENPAMPELTVEHLAWGNYLSRRSVERLIKAADSDIASTPEIKLRNRIEEFIRTAGKSGTTKTDLTRHVKNWTADTKDIAKATDMLVDMESIGLAETKPNGRKIKIWIHKNYFKHFGVVETGGGKES